MRMVQADHSWRRVSEDWQSDLTFSHLRVHADQGFEASDVTLNGGACIVAGVNSGGKSRLIKSIYGEIEQGQPTFTTVTWKDAPPTEAVLVDFFELLIRQANVFGINDLEDLVESEGLTPISPKKLRNINWVLGREYSQVRFAELENPGYSDNSDPRGRYRPEVVPYFQVTHQSGEAFSSEHLSRGELAALTLSWVLESLKPGKLYLFDEPDLMLSPHSSERAIDLLINKVNDLKSPAFIATHSYHTLASVPAGLLVHLNVGLTGYSIASRPDDDALWKTLKVAAPVRAIFVVEDEAAKALLKSILSAVSPQHHDLSNIWIAGDASKVTKAGEFPRSHGQTVQIFGVLDGNEEDPDPKTNILKLPGGRSPEEGALKVLKDHPEAFRISRVRANELLARHSGVDPHDQARDIAESLGLNHLTFMVVAWTWWFKEDETAQTALNEFRNDLLNRVPL